MSICFAPNEPVQRLHGALWLGRRGERGEGGTIYLSANLARKTFGCDADGLTRLIYEDIALISNLCEIYGFSS